MKRNRTTLKDFFRKGAIPSEENFADLIDSMLNQDEDSISKLGNDPLKISANGDDEALINFYPPGQAATAPSWQIKQKADGKTGLSIGDATTSRLFIDSGTGNVGIGTTAPQSQLHLAGGQWDLTSTEGDLKIGDDTFRLKIGVAKGGNGAGDVRIRAQGGTNRLFLGSGTNDVLTIQNGVVSFGSNTVHFGNNAVHISNGSLNFGAQVRQMINLWSTSYGIGVQHSTQYFRAGANFAWYRGGSHADATLNPGPGGARMMALNEAGDLILSNRTNPTNDPSKSQCRALVDFTNRLILNMDNDFSGGTEIWSNLLVKGNAAKPGGGVWAVFSDIKLKKNVELLTGSLSKLLQLRGVTYEWKNPEQQGNLTGTQIGMVAQEVEKVFPEWVGSEADGTKYISIRGFEALTVEALRELNSKIESLLQRMDTLEQRIGIQI
jgi:hypothetical protein